MSSLSTEDKEYIRQQVQSIAAPNLQVAGLPVKRGIEPSLLFAIAICIFAFALLYLTMGNHPMISFEGFPWTHNQDDQTLQLREEGFDPLPPEAKPIKPRVKPKPKPKVDTELQKWKDRVWIAGAVVNNNAEALRQMIGRYDPELAKKIVFIDYEWNLDRQPELLNLQDVSDEDRQNLLKHIKKSDVDQDKLRQEYQQGEDDSEED